MILKTYTGHISAFADISRLNTEFLKSFKRSPKSQLVYSQSGNAKRPVHGISIWDGDKYPEEVEFFRSRLN
jgi:hypothetical protein